MKGIRKAGWLTNILQNVEDNSLFVGQHKSLLFQRNEIVYNLAVFVSDYNHSPTLFVSKFTVFYA